MRSALARAGFHVLDDADTGAPGLRVTAVPAGALVGYSCSNAFTSMSRPGRVPGDDSMTAIVHAAVSGLLVHLGHTVAQTPGDGGLLVLADVITAPDGKDGLDLRASG